MGGGGVEARKGVVVLVHRKKERRENIETSHRRGTEINEMKKKRFRFEATKYGFMQLVER